MSDDTPRKDTRFQPGQSGNPKGRPKKGSKQLAELVDAVFNSDVEYSQGGQKKTMRRKELALTQLIRKGIRGSLACIAAVLDLWDEAKKSRRAKPMIIVENWMPDRPGQTAEQKTYETAAARAHEQRAKSSSDGSTAGQPEGA